MENPIKMDDLGVPLFLGNTHRMNKVMEFARRIFEVTWTQTRKKMSTEHYKCCRFFWRVLSLWNNFYNSQEREVSTKVPICSPFKKNIKWKWNFQRWKWNFYSNTSCGVDKIALVETLQLENDHICWWSVNKAKLLWESRKRTNGCTHKVSKL